MLQHRFGANGTVGAFPQVHLDHKPHSMSQRVREFHPAQVVSYYRKSWQKCILTTSCGRGHLAVNCMDEDPIHAEAFDS
jgi:hypothetical protein